MVRTFENCKVHAGNFVVSKRGLVGKRKGMLYIPLPADDIGQTYQVILIRLEKTKPGGAL